ncbi:MAG: hypothetical protein NVSMB9_01830 [Isosphaeraceae bacterium]
MSGPIVRKYGFPNFDEIFGKKELQHGVEETPAAENSPGPEEGPTEKPVPKAKPERKKKGKP